MYTLTNVEIGKILRSYSAFVADSATNENGDFRHGLRVSPSAIRGVEVRAMVAELLAD